MLKKHLGSKPIIQKMSSVRFVDVLNKSGETSTGRNSAMQAGKSKNQYLNYVT
jgi:hypothetical protein